MPEILSVLLNVLFLVLGMVLLIKGADFFVDGSSRVAKALKIPALIIGLTLVSIGTSLPELAVSLTSSLKGANDLSFGNVVGSNIFNVLVVIGASALFTPMIVAKSVYKYDIPVLIGIYAVVMLFGFVISPLIFATWESIIILVLFVAYMFFLVLRAKQENDEVVEEEAKEEKPRKMWLNIVFIILGCAAIIFGGEFVVTTASTLAKKLGMSELLISLTIVSVGTSLPELVTSMVAAKKGENDIAVGNAIGSCIFNILLILGLSSTVSPISIQAISIIDNLVMALSVILIAIFAFKARKITRTHGIIMVSVYAIYLAYIVLRNIYPEVFAF